MFNILINWKIGTGKIVSNRTKSCSRYELGLNRNLYISIVEIKRFPPKNVIRVCQKKTVYTAITHSRVTHTYRDRFRANQFSRFD